MKEEITNAVGRALLLVCLWALMPVCAMAADAPAPQPNKSYLVGYILVAVFIGVGLIVLCRPSKRGDEIAARDSDEDEE